MAFGPIVPFDPWQQRWIDDESRFCIINKARQIGISFAETWRETFDCARRRARWHYLSVSEARAQEAIEYCQMHAEAMGIATKRADFVIGKGPSQLNFRKAAIEFPWGSRIVGLPANPRTARGCSGNICLDEFGHHQDAAKIWTALQPLVTRGYSIRIITTPNGRQGEFYRIWTKNNQYAPEHISEQLDAGRRPVDDIWSRHETNVHQAVDQALPGSAFKDLNLELLRELAGTEDNWRQEYCCEFLDESLAWLPYSLIEGAHHPDATMSFDSTQRPAGPLYVGCDVARKRDLFVVWANEMRGNRRDTRAVMTMQGQKFSTMRRALFDFMQMARRGCIDETGVGAQLAEETVDAFPGLAEGVSFNGQIPALLATKAKKVLEDGQWGLPDSVEIRQDFHSVRRTVTGAGNVRFEAPRTKDGHADRFWAGALALHAEDSAPVSLKDNFKPVPRSYGRSDWSGY